MTFEEFKKLLAGRCKRAKAAGWTIALNSRIDNAEDRKCCCPLGAASTVRGTFGFELNAYPMPQVAAKAWGLSIYDAAAFINGFDTDSSVIPTYRAYKDSPYFALGHEYREKAIEAAKKTARATSR